MDVHDIDIEGLIAEARFVHLDEPELRGYVADTLRGLKRTRVDAHLKLCLLCETRVAQERGQTGTSPAWRIELAVAARGGKHKAQSPDGALKCVWQITEDDTMTVMVSAESALAGRTVEIKGDQFVRRLTLVRLTPRRVGAMTSLSSADRRRLGKTFSIALAPTEQSRRGSRRRRSRR